MKRRLAALAFAAAAWPAAAQTPAPAEERPASSPASSSPASPAPSPGPRLNLKLDNPAQYSREMPKDSGSGEALPSLGGDARSLPARESTPSRSPTSPYPQDTNPNR